MMRKLLLVCFLLGAVGLASAQSVIPKWKITDLEQELATSKQPTVVNFWATFCRPCIVEIPYFQELVKKYERDGVRLLLVSVDLPDDYAEIAPFAKKRGFRAPIRFLDETNADYFCPRVDSSWSGAIPATLFVNPATGYRSFREESLSRQAFEAELRKLLAR